MGWVFLVLRCTYDCGVPRSIILIMEAIGRLLNMGKSSAAMNMAVDEAILLAQKEQPNPTPAVL